MKRILSLILTMAMLMSVLMVGAKADEAPVMTFSLDFSGYDSSTGIGIKNGVTGDCAGITAVKHSSNNIAKGPVVEEAYTGDEDTIKYLSFAKKDIYTGRTGSNYYLGLVRLDRTETTKLFNDDDGVSFEYWVKPYRTMRNADGTQFAAQGGKYLTFYHENDYDANSAFEIWANGYVFDDGTPMQDSLHFRPFGSATLYGIKNSGANVSGDTGAVKLDYYTTNQPEKWSHIVITRDWEYTEGTNGYYDINIYVDGELKKNISTKNYDAMSKPLELENCDMAIGGMLVRSGGETANIAGNGFVGGIAEFNIYNGVLSADEVRSSYDADAIVYENAADKPREITVTTNSENSSITALAGEITVDFSAYINKETIASAVSLVKVTEDGEENLPGGIVVSAPAGLTKELKIKHGTLEENASYKLRITTALKAIGGVALSQPFEKTYIANKSADIANYDFENMAEGDVDFSSLTQTSAAGWYKGSDFPYVHSTDTSVAKLKIATATASDNTTNKYIEGYFGEGIKNVTSYANVGILMPYGEDNYRPDGSTANADFKMPEGFAVEIEYKRSGASRYTNFRTSTEKFAEANHFNLFPNASETALPYVAVGNANTAFRKETAGSYDQTTKNKFGFFHTKQIYTMHGDLDSYKIYTTNIAENQTGRTQIETTKNFTNPQGLHLIHSGNSTYADGKFSFASIKVYEVTPLKVLDYKYDAKSKIVRIIFNDDVDVNTVAKSNIKVTNEAGQDVAYALDASLLSKNREIKLIISEETSVDELLTVALNKLTNEEGIFCEETITVSTRELSVVGDIVFTNQNGEIITELSGAETSVKVTFTALNSSGKTISPTNYLALYSDEAQTNLKKIAKGENVAIAPGETGVCTVTIDTSDIENLAECSLKCISLKSLKSLVPVFSAGDRYCL